MSDIINHPNHYVGQVPDIECIDVVSHFNFCMGNAIKYIWRADYKGNPEDDIRKAIWYLNRELESRIKKSNNSAPLKVLER